ncbi:hypothetical protein HPB47_017884, partial [Ixodes persulcatus]
MAAAYVVYLLQQQRDAERNLRQQRVFRTPRTLDTIADNHLARCYRLSRPAIERLCEALAPALRRPTARNSSGSFQSVVGDVGNMSQTSASRIINSVSSALYNFAEKGIKFPVTRQAAMRTARESTIIADDSDTGDLMDDNEDDFILVEHRRKRSTGVPVAEQEAVRRLLKVKNLCGIEVQAYVSTTYLQNHGLVKGVPEGYSDAQLSDYLAPEGVIAVRHLFHRHGQPGAAAIATDKVLLTFRPNTEKPSQVNLGFTKHDVVEHVVAPPRCFKCQAIGHVAKYCKGETKCKKCG